MRTHGSRQQQVAVRSVPGKQMQKVFEVSASSSSSSSSVSPLA